MVSASIKPVRPKRPVSIETVARIAKISKSTVSNTFTGRKNVTPEIRSRILEIAEKVGYRPHYAAQVLASRKTRMIGVLISELYNPNTGAIVQNLEQALLKHNYKMLLGLTYGNHGRSLEYLRQFATGMVDGIINTLPEVTFSEAVRECRNLPIVTWCSPAPESPVYMDFAAGIQAALEHLWGQGHRKIGFITLAGAVQMIGCRSDIYTNFYTRQGLEPDETLCVGGDSLADAGYRLGSVLHERGATAIYAGNDLMAFGILRWARETGLRVPDDLSVVGFDDNPMATLVSPPLTTVQMPVSRLSEITVQGLIDRIEGKPPGQQEVVVPRLIVRQSTGPVPKLSGKDGA
jgi:DNA-binding LacI/PurR family transcriptional regulator